MLDVEAALARACAAAGMITAADADAIAGACDAALFSVAALGRQAAASGNPVVPLVRELTARVDDPPRAYVHRGATSQDILDTALMLVARRSLDVIVGDLSAAADAAADLARTHRDLPAAARTLLQHAVPTTFGRRAAGWMMGLDQAVDRLRAVRDSQLPVQLGGAAGSRASLGHAGDAVVAHLAVELDLAEPVLPWHTNRVPIADLAAALGTASGVCAKVARDVTLLAQTEVREVTEGVDGRGGSSTMPHKRNPVAAVSVLAASAVTPGLVATLLATMAHEHERAAGAWHAEWLPCTELLRATGSAAAWLRDCLEHLQVDRDRVRANLELTGDLTLAQRVTTALTDELGRLAAHDAVTDASHRALAQHTTLFDQLRTTTQVTAVLDEEALRALLDPAAATDAARRLVDHALARRGTPDRPGRSGVGDGRTEPR
ncbi:MAG: 3-carboxy-cis,cis-muconate cycloisomerase [Actinobacteria bacterium]|nr:3-carboxy-cis,cis-muconate cycloisomerase [Actinomycetota bacterium]